MLRKEEVLERTNNGLNIFRHYIACQWRVGRNFFNPLYEDRKASCNIYFDRRSGVYRIKVSSGRGNTAWEKFTS